MKIIVCIGICMLFSCSFFLNTKHLDFETMPVGEYVLELTSIDYLGECKEQIEKYARDSINNRIRYMNYFYIYTDYNKKIFDTSKFALMFSKEEYTRKLPYSNRSMWDYAIIFNENCEILYVDSM